ncbi:hypothetical protein HJG60_010941 [Phyllostomus discolor]|uniref:Uncharacterized protein n=1 Tax=Phyllostomus discolor TaxID=89673 RepID=A0A834AHQ7_9CHIR|nr:hypothetical protein HJG60_010941 [Phyllostomus discolor]
MNASEQSRSAWCWETQGVVRAQKRLLSGPGRSRTASWGKRCWAGLDSHEYLFLASGYCLFLAQRRLPGLMCVQWAHPRVHLGVLPSLSLFQLLFSLRPWVGRLTPPASSDSGFGWRKLSQWGGRS